jgi:hypothetical protein
VFAQPLLMRSTIAKKVYKRLVSLFTNIQPPTSNKKPS